MLRSTPMRATRAASVRTSICPTRRCHTRATLSQSSPEQGLPACAAPAEQQHEALQLTRRGALAGSGALLACTWAREAEAIQGLTAGRIPGLTAEPDENGFYTYARPEGKSGGHGVGWSEIPAYRFKVPATWEEKPVSIADLGGTEIDLRFTSKDQGEIAVVVAPILRFADIGFNASVTIEELGDPEKIIRGFGPELFGKPLEEEDILETTVRTKPGSATTYYEWALTKNRLVSATAYGNRMFIMSVVASARQWRKHEAELRAIAGSFLVPSKA